MGLPVGVYLGRWVGATVRLLLRLFRKRFPCFVCGCFEKTSEAIVKHVELSHPDCLHETTLFVWSKSKHEIHILKDDFGELFWVKIEPTLEDEMWVVVQYVGAKQVRSWYSPMCRLTIDNSFGSIMYRFPINDRAKDLNQDPKEKGALVPVEQIRGAIPSDAFRLDLYRPTFNFSCLNFFLVTTLALYFWSYFHKFVLLKAE